MRSILRCLHVFVMGAVVFAVLAPTTTVVAQEEGAAAQSSLEEDLNQTWGEHRDIRVIQRRLYEKVGRHQITLFGGIIPNNPFLDYFPVGLRYTYYLMESLGLEVDGSYIGETFRSTGDLDTFLSDAGVNVDLLDLHIWRAHLGVCWSPFYGKLAFLGLKLVHFDINLNAAFGVVGVRQISENRLAEEDEFKVEGALGAGFNFFINDMFSIRLDYRQYLFQKAGGGVSNPSEITLGFSVFL